MNIEQTVFPLTCAAFASALKTGHGRAVHQVSGPGSNGLEDQIIEACVYCQSYDPQCEAERAPWLYGIASRAGLESKLIQAIEALMRKPPPEDHRDLDQRSAMLKELAAAGVGDARRLLYQSLARLSDTVNVIAGDQIVALDGVDGLIHVARQLGRWLREDPEFWVDACLIEQLDAAVGSVVGLAALLREAASDSDIARYLAGVRDTRDSQEDPTKRANPFAMTGAQIVAHVRSHPKDRCHWFRGWGHRASADQREVVFAALLDEHEPAHAERLLRCFAKTGVPRFDTTLLHWVFQSDRALRGAAVQALGQHRRQELREAALQFFAEGDLENGVRLLVANFRAGDLSMCAQRLEPLADADQCHRLGVKVLALCEAHPCSDALGCLLYVYEFSPCSTCRQRAVASLIEAGIAPAWLLEEAAMDADPDTRTLAANSSILSK